MRKGLEAKERGAHRRAGPRRRAWPDRRGHAQPDPCQPRRRRRHAARRPATSASSGPTACPRSSAALKDRELGRPHLRRRARSAGIGAPAASGASRTCSPRRRRARRGGDPDRGGPEERRQVQRARQRRARRGGADPLEAPRAASERLVLLQRLAVAGHPAARLSGARPTRPWSGRCARCGLRRTPGCRSGWRWSAARRT